MLQLEPFLSWNLIPLSSHWKSYVSYVMFCSHQVVFWNAYFQNGHGLEEAQICLTKERAGRRRGRHQKSQLKIIQICLNYIIHISYKYYTNIIQMLYKYDINISQILYKYQKNIIQICSTKEGAGRRRDADIGRHQNLAEPAWLQDSWGTKYKRDADIGSHQNPKTKSCLYCSSFQLGGKGKV